MWRVVTAIISAAIVAGCASVSTGGEHAAPAEQRDPALIPAIDAIKHARDLSADVPIVEVKHVPTAVTAAGGTPNGLPPDIATIKRRGQLRVAMLGTDNPPFFRHVDGKLEGLDVVLARSIAKVLSVPLVVDTSAKTFNDVVAEVELHHVDLGISKLSRTLARAETVVFSDAYVQLHRSMLVNRLQLAQIAHGDEVVPRIQHFDARLGVIKGSSYVDYARVTFPNATLVEYPDWASEVAAARNGDIVAAFRDELEVKNILEGDPGAALVFQNVIFSDSIDSIAIASPYDDTTLRYLVNQFLDASHLRDLPVDAILAVFPLKAKHS